MVNGSVRGGSLTTVQERKFGSRIRWLKAASDRGSAKVKLLNDDPHRQTKEDIASIRGSPPWPHLRDTHSREVGKHNTISVRRAEASGGTAGRWKRVESVTRFK